MGRNRSLGIHSFINSPFYRCFPPTKKHAHNPVDWYPWGEEAFKRARELDRPILLSSGYSTCHWCARGRMDDCVKTRHTDQRTDQMLLLFFSSLLFCVHVGLPRCHVMERESFESSRIARLLNERFVPIKVQRILMVEGAA